MAEPDEKVIEQPHQFDGEAICLRCGFDGAEWSYWKNFTHEGQASDARQPTCDVYE